jgi:hypothetical protein
MANIYNRSLINITKSGYCILLVRVLPVMIFEVKTMENKSHIYYEQSAMTRDEDMVTFSKS